MKKRSTLTLVASGTVTLANARLSGVNGGATASGGAFVDFTAAGVLTAKIGHLLEIYDSSNRKIAGWIKAAGTAETTSAELVTDPGFAAVTKAAAKSVVGITKANPGVVTFTAGHGYANGDIIYFSGLTQMTELNTQYWQLRANSGDTFQLATVYDTTSLSTAAYGAAETTGGSCAQKCTFTNWIQGTGWVVGVNGAGALTNTIVAAFPGDNSIVRHTPAITGIALGLYKQAYTVTSYVSGTNRHLFNGTSSLDDDHTTADTFTIYRNHNLEDNGFVSKTGSNFRGIIDNFTLKQILTPSATGATITSTKGGVTYNWAFKNAAFNWNSSSGYTYKIYKSTTAVVVAGPTAVTQANTRLDTTTTNAFVWLNGVDLSSYQDGRHMIGIYNATGKYGMLGHISSSAPAGESLDAELVDGWTNHVTYPYETWTPGAGSSITEAGNTTGPGICYKLATITLGKLYKLAHTITLNSGTAPVYRMGESGILSSAATYVDFQTAVSTTTGIYKTVTSSLLTAVGYRIDPAVVGNFTMSGHSLKNVTDPPSTGAKILKTKGGADRAWFYTNPSFDPNDSAGVTYVVYFLGD